MGEERCRRSCRLEFIGFVFNSVRLLIKRCRINVYAARPCVRTDPVRSAINRQRSRKNSNKIERESVILLILKRIYVCVGADYYYNKRATKTRGGGEGE